MRHIEGFFTGSRQVTLFYQGWWPETNHQSLVILVHGLGSHSGTFMEAVQYLVDRGYGVYGFDLRGHGRSGGQRGYVRCWDDYRTDLRLLLQGVADQWPGQQLVLWGHSLGAVVALDYGYWFPEDLGGLIISGLPIAQVGVSPVRLVVGRLLSRLWPRFSLNTGIQPAANTRDQVAIATHLQDPLRHHRGTARLTTEFLRTTTSLRLHAADLRLPLLMLHGGADRTAPATASHAFFDTIGSTDKQWRLYPDSYHDLHNDLDAEIVLGDLVHWLDAHFWHLRSLEEPVAPFCEHRMPVHIGGRTPENPEYHQRSLNH